MFVGWQATGLVFEVVQAVELVVDDVPRVVVPEGPGMILLLFSKLLALPHHMNFLSNL